MSTNKSSQDKEKNNNSQNKEQVIQFAFPLSKHLKSSDINLHEQFSPLQSLHSNIINSGNVCLDNNHYNQKIQSGNINQYPLGNLTFRPDFKWDSNVNLYNNYKYQSYSSSSNEYNNYLPNYYNSPQQPINSYSHDLNRQMRPHLSSSILHKQSQSSNQQVKINNIDYDSLSLEEVRKRTPYFCKEQQGCRFLQIKVDNIPYYAEINILPLIYPVLIDIINDQFGNYLIQKIIDKLLSPNALTILINYIYKNIYNISFNKFGTRVVQKIMEKIENRKEFIELLKPFLSCFLKNENSYFIIIKCFDLFYINDLTLLFDYYNKYVVDISCSKFGCVTLQKCLDIATNKNKNIIISKIIGNLPKLIADIHANYVISYVIQLKNRKHVKKIITKIITECNILELLTKKSSLSILELLTSIDFYKLGFNFSLILEIMKEYLFRRFILDPNGCISKWYYIISISNRKIT